MLHLKAAAARAGVARCPALTIGAILALVPATILTIQSYNERNTPLVVAREATERIAKAIEHADKGALLNDPLLKDHPDWVDWLLQQRDVVLKRHSLRIFANGLGGRQMLSKEDVSHLATIRSAAGEVWLGFKYDLDTVALTFVTAARRGP
jgi:hypothetical protein